jgi:negative regulator of sigma E activity
MAGNFLKRIGFLTPLATVVLVLVVVNVLLSLGNQTLRVEVNERQQMITQTLQLEGLNREIVTVLASIAVKANDEQLMSLLASQGISFEAPPGLGKTGK